MISPQKPTLGQVVLVKLLPADAATTGDAPVAPAVICDVWDTGDTICARVLLNSTAVPPLYTDAPYVGDVTAEDAPAPSWSWPPRA